MFTEQQDACLKRGLQLTNDLKHNVETALGLVDQEHIVKRHYYIFSPPGAGKTFTVQSTADANNVKLVKFQGNTSIFAFCATVASAAYLAEGKPMVVWVDDCDGLFFDQDGLSLMKGVLDEDRNILSYNKSMFSYIQQLEKSFDANATFIADALKFYQPQGGMGVEVPTNNLTFIVTSNMRLTPPSGNIKNKRKMNEAAIRDRVNYIEYDLEEGENWGWVGSQLMNNDVLGLTPEQKGILLNWMWENWERMPSRSMRAVRDMAARMLNTPDTYITAWNLSLMAAVKK